MLAAMDAVRSNNTHVILSSLVKFSFGIRTIGRILKRMYEHCDPNVFYNDIRPFLAGSKNMAVAGLPKGVFYEEGEKGEDKGEWRFYSGGSNAQSSLIQFFDVVLGVEHSLTGGAKGSTNGFLEVSPTFPNI
jgi:indoleamine 2,3-dioxygenase